MVNFDWDEGGWFLLVIAAIVVCVPDGVVLPWYFSFVEVMCDNLSANIARVFKLIRHSLGPVGTDGGCGMVASKSCSLAMGWFICFAHGEKRIVISAGRLVLGAGLGLILLVP